jgi:Xaa-Pro dipeptidase
MASFDRLNRLRVLMAAAKLDVVAFVPGPNLTYLTDVGIGLSSDRPLVLFVPLEGEAVLIVPILEQDRLANLPIPVQTIAYSDAEGFLGAFEQAVTALNLGSNARIGTEGLQMRVLEGRLIEKNAPGATVFSADDALMPWRLYKTADELDSFRKAIALSETALKATLERIRPGMTERQIAAQLSLALADAGSSGESFPPLVMIGSNITSHADTTDRAVQAGDMLLFDFGGKFGHYPADITRTFAVGGAPSDQLADIYATVLAANEAGIRASKPGVAALEVDRAARQVIIDAGYGEYFTHRTGHGLGLDIHEPPYMRAGNSQILEPGMVYTVEPGIYIPGVGGARIEDNVVITETGVEVMTKFPKTLQVIGWA